MIESVEQEAAEVPPMMMDPATKQITQSLGLRKQFRVSAELQYLATMLLGFDPNNRDGIPLNGERCDSLLG